MSVILALKEYIKRGDFENANLVLSVLESNVCFNNSNNTNSDETLCECVYTKNNKSNIKYLEEITTDDLIPDSVN